MPNFFCVLFNWSRFSSDTSDRPFQSLILTKTKIWFPFQKKTQRQWQPVVRRRSFSTLPASSPPSPLPCCCFLTSCCSPSTCGRTSTSCLKFQAKRPQNPTIGCSLKLTFHPLCQGLWWDTWARHTSWWFCFLWHTWCFRLDPPGERNVFHFSILSHYLLCSGPSSSIADVENKSIHMWNNYLLTRTQTNCTRSQRDMATLGGEFHILDYDILMV